MTEIQIIQARPTDAPALRQIRLEALQNRPEAFAADYTLDAKTDWTERIERNSGETGAIFLAYVQKNEPGISETDIAGMMGIFRGASSKVRHSATIWGVYVSPRYRKSGIGSQLLQTCLDWAKAHRVEIVKLGVVTTIDSARRLYERNGFKIYGNEPKALFVKGIYYDEFWMAREIEG